MAIVDMLRLRAATGLLLGEQSIVATSVARTPVGVRDLGTHRVPVGDEGIGAAVETLVAERKLPGVIVCGVSPRRLFMITRRLTQDEESQSASDLLGTRMGHLRGGIVAGKVQIKLPNGSASTLVACSRATAQLALNALMTKIPGPRLQLQPVPLALFAMAARTHRRPRRWRAELRVCFGPREGLAMLAHGGHPLAMLMFECPPERRVESIDSAILNLTAHAREGLGIPSVDGAILHIGEDQAEFAGVVEDAVGLACVAAPELACDDGVYAQALAASGLAAPRGMPNLFEDIYRPTGLLQTFPLKAAVLVGMALGGTTWKLYDETSTLEGKTKVLKEQAKADIQSVGFDPDDLEKRHEALGEEYKLAQAFIAGRIYWGEVLQALPRVVPPTMQVDDLTGRDAVEFPRKKSKTVATTSTDKPRQLSISGIVPLADEDSSPPELARLTSALEHDPVVGGAFPRISNSNMRLVPGVGITRARLVVTCSP